MTVTLGRMNCAVPFLIVLAVQVFCTCCTANSDNQTVFLERGHRGAVPCLPISSHDLTTGEISAVYWYFGHIGTSSLLVSYFRGEVAPQNGIPEGVYDIDREFSLIIRNVTDSNDGKYWYKVKPYQKTAQDGKLTVIVKVTPTESTPSVQSCQSSDSRPGACEVHVPYDTSTHRLTCEIHNAKPAVDIRWLNLVDGAPTEILNSPLTIQNTVLQERTPDTDWFRINNTYNTSASITIRLSNDDVKMYRCEAHGVALGDKSGSHMTATIKVLPPKKTDNPTPSAPNDEATSPLAIALPLCSAIVLLLALSLFIVRKYNKHRAHGHRTRPSSRQSEHEPIPLADLWDLDTFKDVLKTFFITKMQTISTGLLSDSEDTMHTDSIFIELELLENDRTVTIESREEMIQLIGGRRNRKHFVLKGRAGCGKSTFIRRIGFDWGNGSDYLSHFSLMFVLKLKDISVGQGLLDAILEQNFPKDKVIDKACLRRIIDTDHEGLLISLDGLDEISSTVLNSEVPQGDISIREVLAGNSLTGSNVIVTTRPHMVSQLLNYNEVSIYTVIETTGFSKNNRNEYIHRRFPNTSLGVSGVELIQEIETRAFLEILAKIPIMLKFLCCVCKEGESIPARITQLYGQIIEVLVRYWARRQRISPVKEAQMWNKKRQEELGKIAFQGLMDPNGERLVFRREDISKKTLNLGFDLGLFLEETRSELCVTFSHKSFQEYYAAYYLVRQTNEFIERQFLSMVNLETIERVEYLLRFACGMSERAASLIFHHVGNIKDDLISDRYLWVQHLTLMLYYEAHSESLDTVVGSRLALKYKEEFEALHYYVEKIQTSQQQDTNDFWSSHFAKVHLHRLEIYLHVIKDQSKVSSILQHVDVERLYFGLLVTDELGEDMEQLSKTISELPYKPSSTVVCIDEKTEDRALAGEGPVEGPEERAYIIPVLTAFCDNNSYISGFGLRVECDILKSRESFAALTSALGEIKAVYFGVLNNTLTGYMEDLSPIIPYVQYIELYNCALEEGDLMSLAGLLGNATRLRELYISGARFTDDVVDTLVRQLLCCPQMLMLGLHDVGVEPRIVQAAVTFYFPEMTPAEGIVQGQFWLKRREPQEVESGVDEESPLVDAV